MLWLGSCFAPYKSDISSGAYKFKQSSGFFMDVGIAEAFVLSMGAIGFGSMLLVRGGDWTVDSAVYFAERLGISPLIIGFTVLAFGTSLPELLVSVLANLRGSPGIALGNVVGSNIANIALVLAVGAIMAPLVVKSKAVFRDLIFMLLATGLFTVCLLNGWFGRWAGFGMIIALFGYIVFQYVEAKQGSDGDANMVNELEGHNEEGEGFKNIWWALLFLGLGMGAIAIGAEFLVRGARIGAFAIGVPEAVIALSLIAFGTSLPELSTSIIAARRGYSDMMLGNIVGSNVFNILMIIGISSLIKPIDMSLVAPQLAQLDVWVMVVISLVLAALIFVFKKISRIAGIALILAYILYNITIYAIYVAA